MKRKTCSTQPKFVKVRVVADELGLTPQTIRAAVRRGELPGLQVGGVLLVSREAFETLVSRGCAPVEPQPAA